MTGDSRLGSQLEELAAALTAAGAPFALIGGLALASHNVVRATQDLEDIRALLRANRATINIEEVRNYFRVFEREALLDELMA